MGLPARALSCPVAVWGVLSGTKIGLDREPEQSEAKTKEANVSRKWGHPLEHRARAQTANCNARNINRYRVFRPGLRVITMSRA